MASTISLSQIAVGGGSALQADAVWALNSAGNVYRASKSGSSWTFSQVPGSLDLIGVGSGPYDSCHPYEVWGLNTSSEIFRYNFCRSAFDQMDGFLCAIQVGSGDVWGSECGPNVFHFDFSVGRFTEISDPFGAFPQLAVGTGGAWAIDTGTQKLYEYTPFSGFEAVDSSCQQVSAGGDGVWFLAGDGIKFLLPNTTGFLPVDGVASPVSLSVGSGAGVWAIDSSHQVYAFSVP